MADLITYILLELVAGFIEMSNRPRFWVWVLFFACVGFLVCLALTPDVKVQ